jgi:hypothetical protein
MDPLLWIVAGSALVTLMTGGLVYFVTQSHAEVQLAKQREELAAARATLAAQKEAMVDSLRNAQEGARRQALDDFMADIRVEERHYVREQKALFITRKSVVRQERIFFRNLPLSNWVEQEMPYEEGADIDQLAKTMAVFIPEGLLEGAEPKPRKLLRP